MSKTIIFGDSTCDLGKDLREKYDIRYLHMNYVVDEKEYPASLDWDAKTAKEFYDLMRNGKRVRTTQTARDTYETTFTKYLEEGCDVVYIGCSSALSGSVNLAKLVQKELAPKYPNNKLFCIDALNSSLGQGHMLIRAAQLRSEGKTATEIADYIEANKLRVHQFATVETLEYLRRAGRVKASKAFFGNHFGVKPIILSDRIGQNFAFKKAKGTLNARKEVAAQIVAAAVKPEEQTLYISHADVLEGAEFIRDEILKQVKFRDVYINHMAPIVGASVGPGTINAYCVGEEVTILGDE